MQPATRSLRWTLALLMLLGCLPMLLAGCSRPVGRSYEATAPPDDYGYYDEEYADYGGGGGGGEYEREYRLEEAPPAPAPEPTMDISARASRRQAAKQKASFGADKKERLESAETPAETSTATTDDTAAAEPIAVDVPEAEQPAPIAQKRQIIYTATMQVSVYDLDAALEAVESLPERHGGWLHQRIDNQLVLRIPAEKLEQAMAEVAELGVVDYRLLEALDVTAEYTDLESRIRVLEEMQKQLQALLARAKSVEQALEIRRALDEITLELEAARAHMRELAKSIAFSTLILRLVERGPEHDLPSSNDPFPWVDELGVEATDYR